MTGWTNEAVRVAAAASVRLPEGVPQVVTDDYLVVDFPPGYDDDQPTQVQWTRSDRPADVLVAEVIALVRSWGRTRLGWWVRLDSRPSDLRAHLERAGAEVTETVAVLAADISTWLPEVDGAVRCELVHDEGTLRDARTVYAAGWGRAPDLTSDRDARELAEALTPLSQRSTFQVVGYLDGQPACAGGCSYDGDVAQLFGATTTPSLRGRGAYRAVVRARLELAREQGATLGLVKARTGTSKPILTSLGFTAYGEEPLLALDL